MKKNISFKLGYFLLCSGGAPPPVPWPWGPTGTGAMAPTGAKLQTAVQMTCPCFRRFAGVSIAAIYTKFGVCLPRFAEANEIATAVIRLSTHPAVKAPNDEKSSGTPRTPRERRWRQTPPSSWPLSDATLKSWMSTSRFAWRVFGQETKFATESKLIALLYDVSWFQKSNFYEVSITSKFSTESCVIPALLVINMYVKEIK